MHLRRSIFSLHDEWPDSFEFLKGIGELITETHVVANVCVSKIGQLRHPRQGKKDKGYGKGQRIIYRRYYYDHNRRSTCGLAMPLS